MSVLPGKLPPISTGSLAGGLLAAARTLPAEYGEWRQGISFNSVLTSTIGYQRCVNPADAEDKEIGTVGEPAIFDPFLLLTGVECSTWMNTDELLSLARAGMEAGVSGAIARQLQEDQVGTNPSLNSTAEYLGTYDMVEAFSQLFAAGCSCGLNELVFHVNVRAIPYLLRCDLVEWDGTNYRVGPYLVVADCYDDEVVPDDAGADVNAVNTTTLYLTGPVEVAVGPRDEEAYGIDAPTNNSVGLVERLGILRFDPNCVKAVRMILYGSPPA